MFISDKLYCTVNVGCCRMNTCIFQCVYKYQTFGICIYKENNHSHFTFAPDVRGQIKDGEIINFHAPP